MFVEIFPVLVLAAWEVVIGVVAVAMVASSPFLLLL